MSNRTRKIGTFAVVALVLGFVALYGAGINDELGNYGDNGTYLILARSLATDGSYRNLEVPGAPPHLQNPPLFPLLLAPLTALGRPEATVVAAKIFVGLVGLLAAVVYLSWAGRVDQPWLATLSAIALVVCPLYYQYAHSVMSDVPAVLFCMLGLIAIERCSHANRLNWTALVCAALAIAAAGMTRTICWTLAPAAAAAILFGAGAKGVTLKTRLTKCLVLAALCALPLVAWQVRCQSAREETTEPTATYMDSLRMADPQDESKGTLDTKGLIRRFWHDTKTHASNIRDIVLPKSGRLAAKAGLEHLLGYAIAGAIVLHLLVRLVRKREAADWFVLLFLLPLLLWPWDDARFLIPIAPLLLFHFFGVLGWLGRVVRLPRLVPGLALLAIVAGSAVETGRWIALTHTGNYDARWGKGWINFREMVDFAAYSGEEEPVVMCRKPGLAYWWTGVHAVQVPYTNDPKAYRKMLERHGVDYLIVDAVGRRVVKQARPVILEYPLLFERVVYHPTTGPPRGTLYRITLDAQRYLDLTIPAPVE